MWHALRAELSYQRSYLLGGMGLAVGVVLMMTVIFYAVGDEGMSSHAAAGLNGMFLMMAPMIVGFIAQSFRTEEHRTRLLLAGPLTPKQIAGTTVLLTVLLFGVGLLGAALVLGIDFLVTGRFERESLQMVVYVGGLLFAMLQLGLLIQEAVTAREQQRLREAVVGWACFVLAVVLVLGTSGGALWGYWGWFPMNLASLAVALMAVVASVSLYAGRTDFTH